MKAILAAAENWAIGKDGGLLVHLPGDLKYFKTVTLGKTVIMGRVTLESLPGKKPLPNRRNIVLTRGELQGDFEICHSLDEVTELLGNEAEEAFVIGGQQIYTQMLPLCDEIYVTKLHKEFPDADAFFPNLDKDSRWKMEILAEPVTENEVTYQFVVYRRK